MIGCIDIGKLSRDVRALDLAGLLSGDRSCEAQRLSTVLPDLGLPPTLALWWGPDPPAGPCETWACEEQCARSVYTKYASHLPIFNMAAILPAVHNVTRSARLP